mmetsp:Transcript_14097/g.34948  ORF Transcript_14097/g.34948 Transcript_14097/m.34948 type:complete len:232 (+) Transcript_14097:598-1293(+)
MIAVDPDSREGKIRGNIVLLQLLRLTARCYYSRHIIYIIWRDEIGRDHSIAPRSYVASSEIFRYSARYRVRVIHLVVHIFLLFRPQHLRIVYAGQKFAVDGFATHDHFLHPLSVVRQPRRHAPSVVPRWNRKRRGARAPPASVLHLDVLHDFFRRNVPVLHANRLGKQRRQCTLRDDARRRVVWFSPVIERLRDELRSAFARGGGTAGVGAQSQHFGGAPQRALDVFLGLL